MWCWCPPAPSPPVFDRWACAAGRVTCPPSRRRLRSASNCWPSSTPSSFARHALTVGQVLLTSDDVVRRAHYRNAQRTFAKLMSLGVVPVVNENDTVATDEIRFGDNDRLAALVAHLVGADALVLLSDVDALYTGDPRRPGSTAVREVTDAAALADIDDRRIVQRREHGRDGLQAHRRPDGHRLRDSCVCWPPLSEAGTALSTRESPGGHGVRSGSAAYQRPPVLVAARRSRRRRPALGRRSGGRGAAAPEVVAAGRHRRRSSGISTPVTSLTCSARTAPSPGVDSSATMPRTCGEFWATAWPRSRRNCGTRSSTPTTWWHCTPSRRPVPRPGGRNDLRPIPNQLSRKDRHDRHSSPGGFEPDRHG